MEADERRALAALPDPVPVFRGYARDGCERGLSWTTERERAEWFAHRFAGLDGEPQARVTVGAVPKAKVIAYLLGRQENEVLALPEDVSVERVDLLDADGP